MQSLQSRITNAGLGFVLRRVHPDAALVDKQIAAQAARSVEPPKGVAARAVIERSESAVGWPHFRLTEPGRPPAVEVVHFHGGGFICELNAGLWRFAHGLARAVPAGVHLPVYPLAPGSSAGETVPRAADLLADVISSSTRPVVASGDSAGAALALLATRLLRDRGEPVPAQLWFQGAWLDLTMSNPAIVEDRALDPVLSVPYCHRAAAAWAGDLPVDDPLVNPMAGDLVGLPPIVSHVGTRDLFAPDVARFCQRATAAGVEVDAHLVRGQLHGYWALRVPETKRLQRDLAAAARRLD